MGVFIIANIGLLDKNNDVARADKLQKMITDEKKRLTELEEVVGFPYQAPGTKKPIDNRAIYM